MGVDAIIALVSLLAPPVIDLVKKLVVKPGKDTPEATMASLALSKPEALADYVRGLAEYTKAQTDFFNRDCSGTLSPWVSNLRAAIRPFGTILSLFILATMGFLALAGVSYDPAMKDTIDGLRYTCEAVASSWFGTRISLTK